MGVQNPQPRQKQKDWFFYLKRVELRVRSFGLQEGEIPLTRYLKNMPIKGTDYGYIEIQQNRDQKKP